MNTRSNNRLENLEPELRGWVLDLAANAQRLFDVIEPLRERGIEVSVQTLRRFVRRHREEILIGDGEDMKGAVEALAKRGQGQALRKGTLEVVRQKLYDGALEIKSPEEARELYADLLREEERLKELELAERKVAVSEEQARLQREKWKLEQRGGGGKKRVAAEVVDVAEQKEVNSGADLTPALLGLVVKLEEILNRGGSPEEKALEARHLLGSERKLLEVGKAGT